MMDYTSFAFVILSSSLFNICFPRTYVSRNTEYGRIIGRVVEPIKGTHVEQFLGVPYAAPPVGELRFERPRNPPAWEGEYDANSYPPACPQMIDFHYINLHRPFFQRENEDCLYLNIYVPRKNQSDMRYAVMLYVHGGSNEVGMGAMFDGDVLAGLGDIIVVTFNYRLGAFGFLGSKERGLEGNYGFLDQVAAMKWVKENIKYFNGDPNRVTLAGHSAGAADVGFHLVSPLTKGLFRYAVMQSGSPLAFWAMSRSEWKPGDNIDENCRNVSCPLGQKTNKHLSYKDYLKILPTKSIQNMPGRSTPGNLITFPAVVDGYYLKERPEMTLRRGSFNGEAFLMSFTKDEGSQHAAALLEHYKGSFQESSFRDVISLYKSAFADICGVTDDMILHEYGDWNVPKRNNSVLLRFTEMLSDLVFVSPMINMADIMSKSTNNIHAFSFAHESAYTLPSWEGVPHGRDLFYLFGAPLVGHPRYFYNKQDKDASRMMIKLWSNFVKTGKLSYTKGDNFPKYDAMTRRYVQMFDNSTEVRLAEYSNFKPRKMAFWNDFLPRLDAKKKCISGGCRIEFLSTGSAYSNHGEVILVFSVIYIFHSIVLG